MKKRKFPLVFLVTVFMGGVLVSCDAKDVNTIQSLYDVASDSESENEGENENEGEKEGESNNEIGNENVILNSESGGSVNPNSVGALLDEYEKTVNQYNDYKDRLSEGDLTVVAEVPALLEKTQILKTKIENIKSDMTTEQVVRLSEIISNM